MKARIWTRSGASWSRDSAQVRPVVADAGLTLANFGHKMADGWPTRPAKVNFGKIRPTPVQCPPNLAKFSKVLLNLAGVCQTSANVLLKSAHIGRQWTNAGQALAKSRPFVRQVLADLWATVAQLQNLAQVGQVGQARAESRLLGEGLDNCWATSSAAHGQLRRSTPLRQLFGPPFRERGPPFTLI